jgi:hypothetical protein
MGLAKKIEPHRPWANLRIHVPEQVRAFFAVAIYSEVGDGANTLFLDRRLAPWTMYHRSCTSFFAVIPKRRTKQRTVQDALTNQTWISDIKGARTVGVIVDYLLLWDVLSDFLLQPDVEDRYIWWFSSDGQYSARTAYKGLFVGSTSFEPC